MGENVDVHILSRKELSTKEIPSSEKSMPPTPPGSPEEMQAWSPASSSSMCEALESGRVMGRPLLNKPLNLAKMKEYNFSHSPNSLRLLPVYPELSSEITSDNPIITRALASSVPKRYRGEKKPIPETQKDGKYFERRKRNNMAAKKSRDARKTREDQIAMRANILEKENAVLRAQVSTLREEAESLRQLLIQKRTNRTL